MRQVANVTSKREESTLDSAQIGRAYAVLRRFVDRGEIPGAVAVVGTARDVIPPVAYGSAAIHPEPVAARPDTIYDCASLTKVVVTTTLALQLIDQGLLHLDDCVGDLVPEVRPAMHRVTIRHLLTHTSGLPAWKPLYASGPERSAVWSAFYNTPLEHRPGAVALYSCLGFILLGLIVERASGRRLDAAARTHIFEPLGMDDTRFTPPPELRPRIAPTEIANGQLIHGVVHDENSRALGGVVGNAGLFSTASDLGRFAQAVLRVARGGPLGDTSDTEPLVSPATLSLAIRCHTDPVLGPPRGLGWLLKAPAQSPGGDLMSRSSFGHTGFTGTSLWIDPERDLFAVLLTNRVHPSRENTSHLRLRPLFHNAVAAALRTP